MTTLLSEKFNKMVDDVEEVLEGVPSDELTEHEQAVLYITTRIFSIDELFRKTLTCFVQVYARKAKTTSGEELLKFCGDLAEVFMLHSVKGE